MASSARSSRRPLSWSAMRDVSTPKALADRIAGAIPQAKLIVLPGAGHGSTLEQPAIVTAAIGAFLDAQSERVAAPRSAAAV